MLFKIFEKEYFIDISQSFILCIIKIKSIDDLCLKVKFVIKEIWINRSKSFEHTSFFRKTLLEKRILKLISLEFTFTIIDKIEEVKEREREEGEEIGGVSLGGGGWTALTKFY